MKKLLLLFFMFMLAMTAMAQRTQKITYQAVVRDAANRLVVYTPVRVDVTITSSTGSYFESLRDTTNANGLMSVEIGGNPGFEDIDWVEAVIKTVITIDGGETVTDEVTVTAVPYALTASYSLNVNPTAPTIVAIYNQMQADSLALANSIAAERAHLDDTLGHYLMEEVQVLRISNDTIYLTGGSFVKLPTGFSGDYNDLINQPDLTVYATNARLTMDSAALHDALIDTASHIRASIPTVPTNVSAFVNDAGYLTSDSAVIVNLNTNVANLQGDVTNLQTNVTNLQGDVTNLQSDVTNLQNADNVLSSRITADSSALANRIHTDSAVLANRIHNDSIALANRIHTDSAVLANRITTDSTILATRMDTLLKHVCDSVKPCVTSWISDSTRMVFDTLHSRYTTLKALNDTLSHYLMEEVQVLSVSNDTLYLTGGSWVKLPQGFSGDYNDLINQPDLTVYATNARLTMDSAALHDALIDTASNIRAAIPTVPTNVSAFVNDAGYLTSYTEVQVLSISNDTIYLTGGSFVKLPTGFSGDYNDLTNVPTKSDLCDSVKPCVTEWISDSTRMVFDTLHSRYTTLKTLNDSLKHYTTLNTLNDTLSHYLMQEVQALRISNDTIYLTGGSFVKLPAGFSGDYNELTNRPNLDQYVTNTHLNDTLGHYLLAGDLCDSIVKCGVIQDMRDSILTNATNITNVQTDINNITGNIINLLNADSVLAAHILSDSVLFYKTDSIILARIIADSTNLANNYYNKDEINDTLSHYLLQEVQALSISNDTIYLTGGSFVKLPAGFSGDYNDLANKPDLNQYVTNAHMNDTLSHYYTNTKINDTLGHYLQAKDLCDSIVKCDIFQSMRDSIQINATNIANHTTSITNNTTNITNNTTNINNITNNIASLQVVDSTLEARIVADSTNLANNYYNKDEINDTLSHYLKEEVQALRISNDTIYLTGGSFVKLPAGFSGDYNDLTNAPTNVSAFNNDAGYLTSYTEVQALSISNDTIYLTGGSFVKLPAGFSGDYNDLTNAPTKSDLCDSVKPCVTEWISDSTRMVFDTLHSRYTTLKTLSDSLRHYTTLNTLNDTLNHYLMEEVQALRISNDTIYLTGGSFVKLPAGFSGDYNDLTNAPTMSDLCDSVKPCVTEWISDSTRMVFDTLHGRYTTLKTLNDTLRRYTTTNQIDTLIKKHGYLTSDSSVIVMMRDSIQKVNKHVSQDSLILAQRIHTDSVAVMDTLHKYYATKDTLKNFVKKDALCTEVMACDDIKNMRDSIQKVNDRLTYDSTKLANRIHTDSVDLAKHISDTARAIRNSLGDTISHYIGTTDLVIMQGVNTLGTFNANQTGTTVTVVIPTPEDQVKSDWEATTGAAEILHKPNIRDSVNRVVLDSLYAANSAMNKAIDTIARNIIHDSLTVVREMIHADSTALAHRMDTLLKHVCDSVKPCVTGWISDSTRMVFDTLHGRYTTLKTLNDTLRRYTTTNQIDTLIKKYGYLTSDSLVIVMMRDSIQKVNKHVSQDSLILAQRIHTDSVVVMDTLHKYYATKDTLKNFVKKDALCTEVMACDDIKNMRDSIQKVNKHVSQDSLILAQRIHTDSAALATRMDTILKHVCDSVKPCVTSWISDSTRMVYDTLHRYYATKDTLKNFVNKEGFCAEVTTCVDNALADPNSSTNKAIDTIARNMAQVVVHDSTRMVFDTLHKYYTSLSTLADSMHRVDVRIKHDSLEVVELYKQAQTALQILAQTEKSDSLTLATRMDTLLKHVCDSVQECVTDWISDSTRMVFDTLHNRYTTLKTLSDSTKNIRSALVDTADAIRSSIGNGKLTIRYGTDDPVTFNANQKTDASITIPVPTAPNDATLTIQKNGTTVGTFSANQAADNTINITVPTCDSLKECDLIKDILSRLDKLERQNDSLAKELEKMKPNLTVSAKESVTVCSGSILPVTYTATFHNCSSSDYTLAWKVNDTDSSAVTGAVLTLNVGEAGSYKVVCIATRSDSTFVTDTVTTTVTVIDLPSFTAEVTNLTVSLTNVVNTAIIQWDTDSVPVAFSGTSAEHIYSVADTITITATSEGGCTFSKGLRLEPIDPTVTTDSVPNATIAATTAKAYGTVTSDGGVPATKRGMVYSTSDQNLELGADGVDTAMNGTGMGSYSCNLNRLVPCTQYYVRAFAFNEVDTVYGEVKNFTTLPFTCGSTLTDIDGNEYGTLLLGSQCWMKQNLRTTHFADGTEIPLGGLNNHSDARRYAPDSNLDTYGYLYNWDAAMNGNASSSANPSGVQGVCPAGWHLPSDAEWTQLTSFVASNSANICENDPDNIAVALASTEMWDTWGTCPTSSCCMCTNPASNNNTQFSVLPAGTWHVNGAAGHTGQGYYDGHAIFRTATLLDEGHVHAREFYTENPYVDATAIDKTNGLSVRCVLTCPTDAAYLPTVSAVTLSSSGATVSMTSNVLADGGATVTERGVCWSTSQHPTTSSDHTADSGTGTGEFTVSGSLTPGNTYYVRAYAINSEGTAYGAEVTYITPMPSTPPTVYTGSKIIALMEGFEDIATLSAWETIDNDGDGKNWNLSSPTLSSSLPDPHSGSWYMMSRSWNGSALHPDNYLITPAITLPSGISPILTFWHKGSDNPSFANEQYFVKVGNASASTVSDFVTVDNAQSSDEYTQAIVNLSSYAGQTIRLAFVHNDSNKEYLCIDDIVVGEAGAGTNVVSDVTATTATSGGYVADDGGATVTARGVCWSTSQNPTIGDSHTTDGSGTGSFTSNITGLSANTTYYVRAYAINSEGPAYGNQVSFKTLNRSLNITSDRAATIKMCGASSQTVTYTATPSNGDASDYTYSWSCSGGTISGSPTSNTATITYTSAATYTVSCTATHNTESFDISKTATTTVQSGGDPTYLGLCNEGLTITSHEEENNKNYRWAFANSISWGDGNSTTITSAQFSHTYAVPGIYTVTISSSGCDVNRTFALGDIVPHPCTVTNAHTNASTYTSSTGGLEAINAEGKVTTVADNDGNTYNVTQIGSQCWMAENLRTTKNPDGTTIAQGSSSTSSDASVAYRYDPVGGVSADPYGYFYNWTAVMNGESASSTNPSNVRGICPLGWHVPSAAEWDVMLTEVGTDKAAKLATGCDWKLDYSTLYYQAKSTPGDCAYPERNSTGFGALPAGTYIDANNYSKTAYFWTTDASSSSSAKFYYFGNATPSVQNNTTFIFNGYSLRCVRD